MIDVVFRREGGDNDGLASYVDGVRHNDGFCIGINGLLDVVVIEETPASKPSLEQKSQYLRAPGFLWMKTGYPRGTRGVE